MQLYMNTWITLLAKPGSKQASNTMNASKHLQGKNCAIGYKVTIFIEQVLKLRKINYRYITSIEAKMQNFVYLLLKH